MLNVKKCDIKYLLNNYNYQSSQETSPNSHIDSYKHKSNGARSPSFTKSYYLKEIKRLVELITMSLIIQAVHFSH